MGVMRKLADSARAKLRGLSEGNVQGIRGKKLAELSDAELEEELQRRRRQRGASGGTEATKATKAKSPPRASGQTRAARPPGWKVRQWFRDLELEPGASEADVERAYQRLLAKYDPDKYSGDAEKHRAAVRLVVGLREAYDGLRDHFDGG